MNTLLSIVIFAFLSLSHTTVTLAADDPPAAEKNNGAAGNPSGFKSVRLTHHHPSRNGPDAAIEAYRKGVNGSPTTFNLFGIQPAFEINLTERFAFSAGVLLPVIGNKAYLATTPNFHSGITGVAQGTRSFALTAEYVPDPLQDRGQPSILKRLKP